MDAIRIVYSTVTYKKDIYFNKTDFHVSEDGRPADFSQFEKYIAPNGMEKVKAIHWGIGTEGNQLSSDTFEAMEVVFLGGIT